MPNRRSRRQGGNGKRRGDTPLVRITVGNKSVSVELYPARIQAVHNRTTMRLFGVSEEALPGHLRKASELRRLDFELRRKLASLYSQHSSSPYMSELREAAELAASSSKLAHDFRQDILTDRFDSYASGVSQRLPAAVRQNLFLRRFFYNPQRAAKRHGNEVARAYVESLAEEIRNWLQLPPKVHMTVNAEDIQRYYNRILETVQLSQMHHFINPMQQFLEAALRIAREGNTQAAHMFYTRTSRHILADLDENIEKRVARLFGQLSFPFAGNQFLGLSQYYIDAAKSGIFGVLAAIDLEEQRSRLSRNPIRLFKSTEYYIALLEDTVKLGARLEEMGASPESASEMLRETPVGARRQFFERLRKGGLEEVALYETLKQVEADARAYMRFLEAAYAGVRLDSSRTTRFGVVQQLVDSGRAAAAAWIVRNPDFWEDDGLEARIQVAQRSRSPELRLQLIKEWNGYAGVQDVITGRAGLSNKRLTDLAARIKALPRQAWSEINTENVENVIAGYSRKEKAVVSPASWIDEQYEGEAAQALHAAYSALDSAGVGGRLRLLNDYLTDTSPADELQSLFGKYARNLGMLPSQLVAAIFNNNRLFQDQNMLEGVSKFLADAAAVAGMAEVYRGRGNALNYMQDWIAKAAPSGLEEAVQITVTTAEEPAELPRPPCIVVVGRMPHNLQDFVIEKIGDEPLDLIFVDADRVSSTYPSGDAVLIYHANSLPHSSRARGFYESGSFRVVKSTGYGGSALVRDLKNLAAEVRGRMNGRETNGEGP